MYERRSRLGLAVRVLRAPKGYVGEHFPLVGCEPAEAIDVFLDSLRRVPGWDMLEIGPILRDWDITQTLLSSARRWGMRPQTLPKGRKACVTITGDWDGYWASRRSLRADVNRYERQLARHGELRFEEYRSGPDLDARLEEFYRVEASGWKGKAGTAISSKPRTRAFHTELAHAFAAQGGLRLYFLYVGDSCAAGEYCLAFRRRIYPLRIGYAADWADYSPGQTIRKRLLQHLFASGEADAYDLARADGNRHHDYKLRWANATEEYVLLRLFNPGSLGGRLARALISGQERLRIVNAWLGHLSHGAGRT